MCAPDEFQLEDYPYVTGTEKDEPQYTIEQELHMMNEQIEENEGFDIDFTLFRCLFNYSPVDLNGHRFVEKPETTRDLFMRLSQKSLEGYNEKECRKYEFVNVVKANMFAVVGYNFLITFEVMDPFDNQQPKLFQTHVWYSSCNPTEYYFCRPKPIQNVECVELSRNID